MTRIVSDVQGTIIDNVGGLSLKVCLAALHALEETGYPVIVASSAPGNCGDIGYDIVDKTTLFNPSLVDAIWVDDDLAILRMAGRFGAITVPAGRLLELAELLCSNAPAHNPDYYPEPNPDFELNPGFIRTPQDERDWQKAKAYYARSARRSESAWQNADWATVTVIYKNIQAKRARERAARSRRR